MLDRYSRRRRNFRVPYVQTCESCHDRRPSKPNQAATRLESEEDLFQWNARIRMLFNPILWRSFLLVFGIPTVLLAAALSVAFGSVENALLMALGLFAFFFVILDHHRYRHRSDRPLLALHEFDKAGFSILGTLGRDTRRFTFSNLTNVIALGLWLTDIKILVLKNAPKRPSTEAAITQSEETCA
jgi:hypothetical protein